MWVHICVWVFIHMCAHGAREKLWGHSSRATLPFLEQSLSLARLMLSDLPRLAPIATPLSLPRTMITCVLHCTGSFHVGSVEEIRSLCSCSNSVKPELSP